MSRSKWYLTKLVDVFGGRVVMLEYGGFTSMAKADVITWQLSPLGGGLMERKSEFKGVLPVKGDRILACPNLYSLNRF